MKLLFVCAGNVQRSPTFENYFRQHIPKHDVMSAGTYHGYPNRVDASCLEWADIVYVMDLEQARFIKRKFNKYFNKVVVVGISDQYNPEDPELIKLIKFWLAEYFHVDGKQDRRNRRNARQDRGVANRTR